MRTLLTLIGVMFLSLTTMAQEQSPYTVIKAKDSKLLKGKKILYIEREQYAPDHHNTETLFQCNEINTKKFRPGSAMKIYDVNSEKITTLVDCPNGVVRDPELSYNAKKIIFSMRNNINDYFHIYEINVDGTGLKQLTFATGVSDIDPVYLPDGNIIFASTRQPKYCMCNRHIMCNLFRMEADGANIQQIGVSTLFEGHPTLLDDGRILYDRWEYVDRNFGDAQGLWVVNPDGTKHAIYYGNNTTSPGGVIDARQIPDTDLVVAIFGSCHDRPWGSLAIIDRKKGVDGEVAVDAIMPKETRANILTKPNLFSPDRFSKQRYASEDPWPLSTKDFLVSGTTMIMEKIFQHETHSALFLMNTERDSREMFLKDDKKSLFDPMIIAPRKKPQTIPANIDYDKTTGVFYVQDVYTGTHMKNVAPGSVKYIRVVETPEKRTWSSSSWGGQGAQAPGVNWHSFEVKKIIGETEVNDDGSVSFEAPAGKHLFFQLLDKDKKMIQSMRSGVSLMPGEVNGCIGCHEDRLSAPISNPTKPKALNKPAVKLTQWIGREPHNFSFMEHVQPILDKHCVKCHDFDKENPAKFVLAKDKNMFFNAAYMNMHIKKVITVAGGGFSEIMQAYSWGTHASKLTKIIEERHHKVKLNTKEKEMLYTWMDMNAVYYPTYETSFDVTPGGRCPLDQGKSIELLKLCGIDYNKIKNWRRTLLSEVSFDRPELSPCLHAVKDDKAKYDRVLELIKMGQKILKENPRGDIENDIVICDRQKAQLENSAAWHKIDDANKAKLRTGEKYYDKK